MYLHFLTSNCLKRPGLNIYGLQRAFYQFCSKISRQGSFQVSRAVFRSPLRLWSDAPTVVGIVSVSRFPSVYAVAHLVVTRSWTAD